MMRIVLALASLKFTPVGLLLLGVASLGVYQFGPSATPWLAGPLLLLAVNLIAAVATNATFRRQMPLLVFHLALIALVLLAAAGRLTYLNGTAAVTEGLEFDGLKSRDAGPLHYGRLDKVRFVNEGFDIFYMAGPVLDRMVNRVRWLDGNGVQRTAEIEHNRPLILFGYRFYPTSNKGFAPVLLWRPAKGEPVLGALHLPPYPASADNQAATWQPGGTGADIWLMLEVEESLIPADRPSRFRLPEKQKIVVRYQGSRWEMLPGEKIMLPDGVLEYHELRTWMGYKVFYDWTIPWILASCIAAIASMAWHFWRKFASKPWNKDD
ncbi:MAG TPA: cytochrome c biogenesis protein ResB [Noviherbaspirillum sp.]|nr:cytochrome c biogenesis protein ResB [Noviherbaspirillum sp.]